MGLKAPKYFLVSSVTVPCKEGQVLVSSLQSGAIEEPAEGGDGDPFDSVGRADDSSAVVEPGDEKAIADEQKRWEDYVKDHEAVKVANLTWAVPLQSRASEHILEAAAQAYSRLRAMLSSPSGPRGSSQRVHQPGLQEVGAQPWALHHLHSW